MRELDPRSRYDVGDDCMVLQLRQLEHHPLRAVHSPADDLQWIKWPRRAADAPADGICGKCAEHGILVVGARTAAVGASHGVGIRRPGVAGAVVIMELVSHER